MRIEMATIVRIVSTYKTACHHVIAKSPLIADPILNTRDANHSIFAATCVGVLFSSIENWSTIATTPAKKVVTVEALSNIFKDCFWAKLMQGTPGMNLFSKVTQICVCR